ncbi:MAG: hypothetical protein IJJ64_03790 [Butyrivibrio sp.]|nr:hypothetical protein [Butyrivibrio sp.]
MARKQDIVEKNIELHEENRKLLKSVKSGVDMAYLIKDMAQTMRRSLDLVEKGLSLFGDASDLLETSKDMTDGIKDVASILIHEYRYEYDEDYASDFGSDVCDDFVGEE